MIHRTAVIGDDCWIGPGVVLGTPEITNAEIERLAAEYVARSPG